ncbi:MAG: urease accessory UreF family protein [Myxococcales bacterium]
MSSRAPLLRLLQLASPALPIGAYAYSRGLESAVHFGWVKDEAEACRWIEGILERSVASLDGPVFLRLFDAFVAQDTACVERWNDFACAARESHELALEDRQLGLALARVLNDQGVEAAAHFRGRGGYATLFALAASTWGVERVDALSAFLFAFVENQVSCAIKLVPLGQSAGQRILSRLVGVVDRLVQRVLEIGDDENRFLHTARGARQCLARDPVHASFPFLRRSHDQECAAIGGGRPGGFGQDGVGPGSV